MCIFEDIRKSNLVVVAGSPNSGRTTLALNIARQIEVREDRDGRDVFEPVLMYSTVLSPIELDCLDKSNSVNLRKHFYFSSDLAKLKQTILSDLKRFNKDWIDYLTDIDCNTWGLGDKPVIVLDMFHFLDEPMLSNENETVRISKIITELKRMAQELNLTFICTSEVNMDSVKKNRKDLLCLRDSIKIGSIADIVFLIDYENDDDEGKKALTLKNRIGLRKPLFFTPYWVSEY